MATDIFPGISCHYRSLNSEQSNPSIPVTKYHKNLAENPWLQKGQVRNKGVGVKVLESGSKDEASARSRLQELVDQLHFCSEEENLTEATAIHARVLKSDFSEENFLILLNHVMHAYVKCSDFRRAKLMFVNLSRKNVFSWSVMIVVSNENKLFVDGLNYYCKMVDEGICPDKFACCAVLQSCIGLGCLEFGSMIHAQIIIRGLVDHVVLCTTLLNMYAKLAQVEEAYKLFNSMTEHNDVSWNAMISGLTVNGLHVKAFNLFLTMKDRGLTPNACTLLSVTKAVGFLGDIDKANQVHELALELGMLNNIRVGTSLINMYSKCGALLQARSLFDTHFANCEANAPWNAIISNYTMSNYSQQALELFSEMCQNDIKSDVYTYCSVFDAIADLKCSWFVGEVHGKVLKSGHDLMDLNVENAMADAYSKCGCLENVEKIFDRMARRDVVSWTTLITAYSQSGLWENALNSFSLMGEEGLVANQFTFSSVLTACSNLCNLELGRQIHGLLQKLSYETEKCVESALIDMYAKGGNIINAEVVFNRICNPDVYSWTAIISAYAYHGYVARALQHFKKMKQMDIEPSAITLLCVLFACSHAGLVDEGLDYFWSMERAFGLVPNMEHYACVVDLLGRVGHIKEAFEFIMKMPIQPNEMVWQTLLASCRIHGNIEFGEIAAKRILSLCPESSSTYILLSNSYMGVGNFKEGVHLRNVMKEQGVRKEPGYSWITIKGKVHRFYAGDREHPQKDDIYLYLDMLRRKMKALGYMPNLRYALQGEE